MKILMPPSGLIILSDINAKKYIFTNIDGGQLNCGASAFQDTLIKQVLRLPLFLLPHFDKNVLVHP